MVNHLCYDRYKKFMPYLGDFASFLEEHPRLKVAMAMADAYISGVAKKRFEEGRAQWQAKQDEQRARWEKSREGRRAAEAIRQKMDAKQRGSGLMMETEEEAALLRNRRSSV
jgi:hypothetical protein